MLQQDYLMRLILQFIQGIRLSIQGSDKDPLDAARAIEHTIAQATNIDEELLFTMSPESFVMLMQVSAIDEALVSYIVHSMILEVGYLKAGGRLEAAMLRNEQAIFLAHEYQVALLDEESLKSFEFLKLNEFDNQIET